MRQTTSQINEEIKCFLNEADSKFSEVLEALKRISDSKATKEDKNILNDLNSAVNKNIELNAAIYQEILRTDSTLANQLINALAGTRTYAATLDTENDNLEADLKRILGIRLSDIESEPETLVTFDGGYMKYPTIKLGLEDGKLALYYGKKKELLYLGSSVEACKQAVIDKMLNNKLKVFSVDNEVFNTVMEEHPDRWYKWHN